MSSYQDLLKQIEALKQEAEQQRRAELKQVIHEVNAKIAEFGLHASDLKFPSSSSSKSGGQRRKVKPKYVDPTTQATWTGRGHPPRWIKDAESRGRSRNDFLIKGSTD